MSNMTLVKTTTKFSVAPDRILVSGLPLVASLSTDFKANDEETKPENACSACQWEMRQPMTEVFLYVCVGGDPKLSSSHRMHDGSIYSRKLGTNAKKF